MQSTGLLYMVGREIETVSNALIGKEACGGDAGRAAVGFPSPECKKGLELVETLGSTVCTHILGRNKVDNDQSIEFELARRVILKGVIFFSLRLPIIVRIKN